MRFTHAFPSSSTKILESPIRPLPGIGPDPPTSVVNGPYMHVHKVCHLSTPTPCRAYHKQNSTNECLAMYPPAELQMLPPGSCSARRRDLRTTSRKGSLRGCTPPPDEMRCPVDGHSAGMHSLFVYPTRRHVRRSLVAVNEGVHLNRRMDIDPPVFHGAMYVNEAATRWVPTNTPLTSRKATPMSSHSMRSLVRYTWNVWYKPYGSDPLFLSAHPAV